MNQIKAQNQAQRTTKIHQEKQEKNRNYKPKKLNILETHQMSSNRSNKERVVQQTLFQNLPQEENIKALPLRPKQKEL